MKATFLKGVALGSAVSLMTLAATAAFAGTGVGNVFNLGESNRVNARSQLAGATRSAVLNVTNSDKSASASGVSIDVPDSDPPLVVNSTTKVKNLNADLIDGRRASDFQSATSKTCPNGTAIGSIGPNGAAGCTGSVTLPIAVHTTGTQQVQYFPSSLALQFQCIPAEGAGLFVIDTGAFPANVETWHSVDGDPLSMTFTDALQPNTPLDIAIASPWMGQVVYQDHTTVATVNVTGLNRGEDGCEFSGTVEIASQ
jgi:hypothetical protein